MYCHRGLSASAGDGLSRTPGLDFEVSLHPRARARRARRGSREVRPVTCGALPRRPERGDATTAGLPGLWRLPGCGGCAGVPRRSDPALIPARPPADTGTEVRRRRDGLGRRRRAACDTASRPDTAVAERRDELSVRGGTPRGLSPVPIPRGDLRMLILTRKPGESVMIEESVRITVLEVRGSQVKLGIQAPLDVRVNREEVLERQRAEAGLPPIEDLALPPAPAREAAQAGRGRGPEERRPAGNGRNDARRSVGRSGREPAPRGYDGSGRGGSADREARSDRDPRSDRDVRFRSRAPAGSRRPPRTLRPGWVPRSFRAAGGKHATGLRSRAQVAERRLRARSRPPPRGRSLRPPGIAPPSPGGAAARRPGGGRRSRRPSLSLPRRPAVPPGRASRRAPTKPRSAGRSGPRGRPEPTGSWCRGSGRGGSRGERRPAPARRRQRSRLTRSIPADGGQGDRPRGPPSCPPPCFPPVPLVPPSGRPPPGNLPPSHVVLWA